MIVQAAKSQTTKNAPAQKQTAASNSTSASTSKSENKGIFEELETWKKQHEDNMKDASRRLNDEDEVNKYGEESIYDDYLKKEEELSLEFDFMEGKDAEKEDEYEEQIHKLAQGELEKKDANGDGVVTKEEYINDELASLDENDDEATKILTKAYSYLIASLMDQGMGNSDNDGV